MSRASRKSIGRCSLGLAAAPNPRRDRRNQQRLRRRKAARPHIIVYGPAVRSSASATMRSVIDALRESGVTLHTLMLDKARGSMASREEQELEKMVAEGTELTGGRREDLLTPMALSDRLSRSGTSSKINIRWRTRGRRRMVPPKRMEVTSSAQSLQSARAGCHKREHGEDCAYNGVGCVVIAADDAADAMLIATMPRIMPANGSHSRLQAPSPSTRLCVRLETCSTARLPDSAQPYSNSGSSNASRREQARWRAARASESMAAAHSRKMPRTGQSTRIDRWRRAEPTQDEPGISRRHDGIAKR